MVTHIHAGRPGYVTPNDEHEGRGPGGTGFRHPQGKARQGRRGWKQRGCGASPIIGIAQTANPPGDPKMWFDSAGIPVTKSETRQACHHCWILPGIRLGIGTAPFAASSDICQNLSFR